MIIDQKYIAYIAIFSAILSTILTIIKIYDKWTSRRRIEITCYFNGIPEVGNDVIIRNISDKQLIVTYWRLSFCKRNYLKWIEYKTEEPNEDACDIIIPPHSTKKLNFSEERYFDWSFNKTKDRRVFFKLFIAGKCNPLVKAIN
ncbi:MAG: hypothetical protein PHI97_28475 [Desulfobulbus sp.]|nr:hypothetical protein [Desulfobulbus sp.]